MVRNGAHPLRRKLQDSWRLGAEQLVELRLVDFHRAAVLAHRLRFVSPEGFYRVRCDWRVHKAYSV